MLSPQQSRNPASDIATSSRTSGSSASARARSSTGRGARKSVDASRRAMCTRARWRSRPGGSRSTFAASSDPPTSLFPARSWAIPASTRRLVASGCRSVPVRLAASSQSSAAATRAPRRRHPPQPAPTRQQWPRPSHQRRARGAWPALPARPSIRRSLGGVRAAHSCRARTPPPPQGADERTAARRRETPLPPPRPQAQAGPEATLPANASWANLRRVASGSTRNRPAANSCNDSGNTRAPLERFARASSSA